MGCVKVGGGGSTLGCADSAVPEIASGDFTCGGISLDASRVGSACLGKGRPHFAQNLAMSGSLVPHLGQYIVGFPSNQRVSTIGRFPVCQKPHLLAAPSPAWARDREAIFSSICILQGNGVEYRDRLSSGTLKV